MNPKAIFGVRLREQCRTLEWIELYKNLIEVAHKQFRGSCLHKWILLRHRARQFNSIDQIAALRSPTLQSEWILALTAVGVDPNHVAEIIQAAGSRAAPSAVAN